MFIWIVLRIWEENIHMWNYYAYLLNPEYDRMFFRERGMFKILQLNLE